MHDAFNTHSPVLAQRFSVEFQFLKKDYFSLVVWQRIQNVNKANTKQDQQQESASKGTLSICRGHPASNVKKKLTAGLLALGSLHTAGLPKH